MLLRLFFVPMIFLLQRKLMVVNLFLPFCYEPIDVHVVVVFKRGGFLKTRRGVGIGLFINLSRFNPSLLSGRPSSRPSATCPTAKSRWRRGSTRKSVQSCLCFSFTSFNRIVLSELATRKILQRNQKLDLPCFFVSVCNFLKVKLLILFIVCLHL